MSVWLRFYASTIQGEVLITYQIDLKQAYAWLLTEAPYCGTLSDPDILLCRHGSGVNLNTQLGGPIEACGQSWRRTSLEPMSGKL